MNQYEPAAKVADEAATKALRLSDEVGISKDAAQQLFQISKHIEFVARDIRALPLPDNSELVERLRGIVNKYHTKPLGFYGDEFLEEVVQALQAPEWRPIESAPQEQTKASCDCGHCTSCRGEEIRYNQEQS